MKMQTFIHAPVLVLVIISLSASLWMVDASLRRLTNLNFDLRDRTSGIAVADIDQNGGFEIIVAILGGSNAVIQYNKDMGLYIDATRVHAKFATLRDPEAKSVSVCACDIDGDGVEEVYIHNVNAVYGDFTAFVTPDRLIKKTESQYTDVFDHAHNRRLVPRTSGYSVSCVDVLGNGKHSFFVTTITEDGKGTYAMFAQNVSRAPGPVSDAEEPTILLADISRETNVRVVKDGRGISVGPIVGEDARSDIFVTNDNSYFAGSATFRHDGSNVLFRNNGDGTFTDVAEDLGLEDADENGRGSVICDVNDDDDVDVMYVNWLGPARVARLDQRENSTETFGTGGGFRASGLSSILLVSDLDNDDTDFLYLWNAMTVFNSLKFGPNGGFRASGPSAILLVSDLDNDGRMDVVKANTDENNFYPTENQLFTIIAQGDASDGVQFEPILVRDEQFPKLHITGISAADLNANGLLELFISHRPFRGRTFSIYEHVANDNNWVRVMPLTKYGAPSRGSLVTLTLTNGERQVAVIGGGCGYMCQMEPVAHFGLGNQTAREVTLTWPNGHSIRKFLYDRHQRNTFSVSYNGQVNDVRQRPQGSWEASNANVVLPFDVSVVTLLTILHVHVYINSVQRNLC